MKQFFSHEAVSASVFTSAPSHDLTETPAPRGLDPDSDPAASSRSTRIAIYDDSAAAPRVIDVTAASVGAFIEDTAATTYEAVQESGGDVPYTVIREIVENLIHADFTEPVISVLDEGHTVRFADQGPGIPDKTRASLPGFTTATSAMKDHIRGVGSGLPIVQEYLSHRGGSLEIDDNLGRGAVITLRTQRSAPSPELSSAAVATSLAGEPQTLNLSSAQEAPRLSTRQKRVLSLVLEVGSAGPTLVSQELAVGLSTAHRDLAHLESLGLISSDESGKRTLTPAGSEYLDGLLK